MNENKIINKFSRDYFDGKVLSSDYIPLREFSVENFSNNDILIKKIIPSPQEFADTQSYLKMFSLL